MKVNVKKKAQKMLAENRHGRPPIQNIQLMVGYVTAAPAFVRGIHVLGAREASSF